MESKTNKTKNRFDSSIDPWKQLIKISIPILLLSLSNVSYSFIDTLLSIILINDPNFSASKVLGLTFPLIMLIMSMVSVLLTGLSLYLPKKLGKEKYEEGKDIIIHIFVYAFIFCIFAIILLFFIAPLWMNWLGNLGSPLSQAEIDGGVNYIRIMSLLFIFIVFRDIMLQTIRLEDKGFKASIIPMVALPINLFFDWLFMGPLDFNLVGAAVASLIGAFVGFLIAYIYSFRLIKNDDTIINYEFSRFSLETKHLKSLVIYGLNSYVRSLTLITLSIVSTFYTVQLVGTVGTNVDYWKEYVTLSSRFLSLATIFTFAFLQASITLFAFNRGKKDYVRAKKFLNLGIIYAYVSLIIVILIMLPLVNPFLKLFQVNDPNGNRIYQIAFYIRLASLPLALVQYIYVAFYSITKNLKITIINSIIGNIIIGISILSIFYYLVYIPTENTNLFFLSLITIATINVLIFTPTFIKKYRAT